MEYPQQLIANNPFRKVFMNAMSRVSAEIFKKLIWDPGQIHGSAPLPPPRGGAGVAEAAFLIETDDCPK